MSARNVEGILAENPITIHESDTAEKGGCIDSKNLHITN